MRYLVITLALLFSFPTFAEAPVCKPAPKSNKAWTVKCHGTSITKKPDGTCELKAPPAPACQQSCEGCPVAQWSEVRVPVVIERTQVVVRDRPWDAEVRGGLDVGLAHPSTNGFGVPLSGELGLRLRNGFLGGDLYVNAPHGIGAEVLVYPVVSNTFRLHFNAGAVLDGGPFKLPSSADVPRNFDLTAGLGVEVPFYKRLSFVADTRTYLPDPFYLGAHNHKVYSNGQQVYGQEGRYLDVKHVLGNSLLETNLIVGLLFKL